VAVVVASLLLSSEAAVRVVIVLVVVLCGWFCWCCSCLPSLWRERCASRPAEATVADAKAAFDLYDAFLDSFVRRVAFRCIRESDFPTEPVLPPALLAQPPSSMRLQALPRCRRHHSRRRHCRQRTYDQCSEMPCHRRRRPIPASTDGQ